MRLTLQLAVVPELVAVGQADVVAEEEQKAQPLVAQVQVQPQVPEAEGPER